MKKKTIISILIFCIISTYCLLTRAADSSVTLTTDAKSVKEGENFTVVVNAKNDAGLNGIDATVEYDTEVLELVESTLADKDNWMEMDTFPKLTAMWKTSSSDTKSADIYKLTFKVKKIGSKNSTEIKLSGKLSLNTASDETFNNISKVITLTSGTSNQTPSPSPSSSPSTKPSNSPSNSNNNGNNDNNTNNSNSNNSSNKNNNTQSTLKTQTTNSESANEKQTETVQSNEKNSTTVAKNNIPAAGSKVTTIAVLIMIVVTGGASFVFYKKYKDI